ncbi:MAG: flagellar assembly protein FliW [Bryobacteraceae bacterium]|jgi:flagellar assembly factor FliW
MPTLATPGLGPFEYRDEDVLTFPEGLPSFETLRFFLVAQSAEFAPFVFLVSLERPSVRFVCAPVVLLDPDYSFELLPGEGQPSGLEPGQYSASSATHLLLAILTLPEHGPPTANLVAPVLIHPQRRLGVQVILAGSSYSHVTPLTSLSAGEAPC